MASKTSYTAQEDPVVTCPECGTQSGDDPNRETLETTAIPSAKMKCGACGNVWVWSF